MFYPVERRLMLFAQLAEQTLLVTGTADDDVIRVEYNTAGDRFVATVNGESLDFDPTAVQAVRVEAAGGDDTVFVASRPVRINNSGFIRLGSDRVSTILGGDGDDTLTGGPGNDTLLGSAGNDVLVGGSGDDIFDAGDGDDRLSGQAGNDELSPLNGADTIDGGSGDDLVRYSGRNQNLFLSLDGIANDGAVGENGQILDCENITGGDGDDSIVGNSKNNRFTGGLGADTLSGMGGDDVLEGGDRASGFDPDSSPDSLDGGSGNDRLSGGTGDDTLRGQSGDDDLTGHDLRDDFTNIDLVDGGSGADSISIRPEGASAFGRAGNDQIVLFFQGAGDTPGGTVSGGGGHDSLYLGDFTGNWFDSSANVSFDGLANDGEGNGQANILADFEEVFGTEADDRIDASVMTKRIKIDGREGSDTLLGGASSDILIGSRFVRSSFIPDNDSITGNAGDDILRGGAGRDTLTGGPGLDSFNGGFGNDLLNAADGEADTVNGAQGLGDSADVDELLDTLVRVESTT